MSDRNGSPDTKECASVKREKDDEDNAKGTYDICRYCENDPCVSEEHLNMLASLFDTYRDWKTNRQIRFCMYSNCVKAIHGPGLGRGVRKKLPHCLERKIREMAPDEKYTGFIDTNDNK